MKMVVLLSAGLLVIAMFSKAQAGTQDVVYLKNGSIIRGEIIEQIPGESIKLQVADGSIFVFRFDEIQRIVKERTRDISRVDYHAMVHCGLLSGEQSNLLTLSAINGIRVNKIYGVGLGSGWDNYPNGTMIPIYLDQRVYALKGMIAPFAFIDAGYSLGKIEGRSKWDAGGFILQVGGGVRIYYFSMEVGYRLQQSQVIYTYVYGYSGWEIKEKVNYDFFHLSAGFCF